MLRAHTPLSATLSPFSPVREKERDKEREWEIEIERERGREKERVRKRERETGALAPFSYLVMQSVIINYHTECYAV